MNLFSPIFRLFGLGTLSNPDHGYQIGALERTSTSSGMSVSDERALKVSAVWACVQLISNSVASLPIGFYRRTASGREELGRNDPLVSLFHRSPNALMKPRDFRLAMTVQMALWHNAYAEVVRDGSGRPSALMPLRPGRMAPFIDENGELSYHYSYTGGVKVYAPESIFHLKGFGTEGVVGVERNNYARETYGLTVSAETFAAKQFANGGRPGGVITFDTFLNAEQREKARALYAGISEGAVNANRLWILEGGSKYQQLEFTADQMQMLATRSMQLSEIARFFGVPEVMIGAGVNSSSAWPASFEQQLLYFLNFTLNPYLDEWEAAIRQRLIPLDARDEVFADHDVSNFIKMDSQTKGQFLATLVQNGLMTRNEARVVLHLPTIQGGDELTVQTNLAPLDQLELTNAAQAGKPNRPLQSQIRQ
jgi:HK97 family phage portal protein